MTMQSRALALCAVACFVGSIPSKTASAQPSVTTIDAPSAMGGTFLRSVNNHGDLLGISIDARRTADYFQMSYGFYRTVDFPHAGYSTIRRTSWNAKERIVGSYYDRKGSFHGFLFDHGLQMPLDFPGAADTFATSINDKDQITGVYSSPKGGEHAFLWSKGQFTSIDPKNMGAARMLSVTCNSLGHIAATYENQTGKHTYLSINGVITALRATKTQADFVVMGLNDNDEIVGSCQRADPKIAATSYFWSHGVYQALTIPGSRGSIFVQGINNQRQIVGFYIDSHRLPHGFLMTL